MMKEGLVKIRQLLPHNTPFPKTMMEPANTNPVVRVYGSHNFPDSDVFRRKANPDR